MNILNKVTLKILGKNKTRTAVTIIGIILSAAMITAVTTGVSSFQKLFIDIEIEQSGDWYGKAVSVDSNKLDFVKNDKHVKDYAYLSDVGYSKLENSQNEQRPYLYIGGMSDNFKDVIPVNITNGRMPKSADEIIIPESVYANAGVKYKLNDKLTLSVGERQLSGRKLIQKNQYLPDEEKFVEKGTKTYTVVGFYERSSFEPYEAAGYTALTIEDKDNVTSYDIFIKTDNAKGIYDYMKLNFKGCNLEYNKGLLRAMLSSNEEQLYKMLYSVAAVLILIIVFGSISLIYNAFSMSVSERTKQIGLLSSIGATKKQLTKSVLFEALFLSGIGIPVGILSGMGGLAVTFRLTQGLLKNLANGNTVVKLSLSVTWVAIAAAAGIGLVTVLISALLPARRATKMSAIEAIRQSNDIKIKGKKVKTSKLTYKLFGFEGMIASKNFKRNRRKYRATVISLFMSVVLFISASSFSSYLKKTTEIFMDYVNYDISYNITDDKADINDIYNSLSSIDGVTQSGYAKEFYNEAMIPEKYISDKTMKLISNPDTSVFSKEADDSRRVPLRYSFIDDNTFKKYLEENNLNADEFMNAENPKAVAVDVYKLMLKNTDGKTKRYELNLLKKDTTEFNIFGIKSIKGYYYSGSEKASNGKTEFIFINEKNENDVKKLSMEEAGVEQKFNIGFVSNKKSLTMNNMYGNSIILVYPYSAYNKVMSGKVQSESHFMQTTCYFKADNHKKVADEMVEVLNQKGLTTSALDDVVAMSEANRSMILLINIFSYGFIALISLIAMANVFNTISTNIGLRRREFAMLKSVGMTKRGFNRMMNFECLLYGIKGLIYGLPVSFGITYLMYKSVSQGWNATYYVPWQSVVIAVASVFAVVFATMLYSMRKIKKDNPIDALKNENL